MYQLYSGFDVVCVGKGSGNRVLTNRRKFDWDGWRIIAEGMTSEEAFELEALVIETYGFENLHNKLPNKEGLSKGHGGTYGFKNKDLAVRAGKKSSEGRVPWSKGLTKDDPRVAKNTERMARTRWG